MTQIRKHENSPRREVLGHEPHQHRGWHLAPLHDAQFDEPGDDPSHVRQGHARQFGEGGQAEFLGRASERGEDPTLRVGDHRLDRLPEVHR